MEKEIFPEFKIVDFRKARKAAASRVQAFLALGRTTELCLSEHVQEPEQLQLEFGE